MVTVPSSASPLWSTLVRRGCFFLTFLNVTRTPQQTIELKKGLYLCVLWNIASLPFYAYATAGSLPVAPAYSDQRAALDQLLRQSGPRDVPFVNLPQLVRFLDINDKTTMRVVSPSDLSASFGPGVELSRVVLELTNSPITPQPKIWPQWLKDKEPGFGRYSGFED
jgi:hypothetical protein